MEQVYNISFIQLLGRWYVKNIKPTANGEPQEVKIKVRINGNGVILITSANLVDKKAKVEEIPVDNGATEESKMDVGQEVCLKYTFFVLSVSLLVKFFLYFINSERLFSFPLLLFLFFFYLLLKTTL